MLCMVVGCWLWQKTRPLLPTSDSIAHYTAAHAAQTQQLQNRIPKLVFNLCTCSRHLNDDHPQLPAPSWLGLGARSTCVGFHREECDGYTKRVYRNKTFPELDLHAALHTQQGGGTYQHRTSSWTVWLSLCLLYMWFVVEAAEPCSVPPWG